MILNITNIIFIYIHITLFLIGSLRIKIKTKYILANNFYNLQIIKAIKLNTKINHCSYKCNHFFLSIQNYQFELLLFCYFNPLYFHVILLLYVKVTVNLNHFVKKIVKKMEKYHFKQQISYELLH